MAKLINLLVKPKHSCVLFLFFLSESLPFTAFKFMLEVRFTSVVQAHLDLSDFISRPAWQLNFVRGSNRKLGYI